MTDPKDKNIPTVKKSNLKKRTGSEEPDGPTKKVHINEDALPALENKQDKKLPPTGNSFKPDKINAENSTNTITELVAFENELKIPGIFGSGNKQRPTMGRRRKPDPSLATIINPDAKPSEVVFNTEARSPVLSETTQTMMRNAEQFLESKEAIAYINSSKIGFHIHQTRGERSVHINQEQSGDYTVLIVYANAKNKNDQRTRSVLTQDQVNDMAQRYVISQSLIATGIENTAPPTSPAQAEDQRNLQKTQGQKAVLDYMQFSRTTSDPSNKQAQFHLSEDETTDKKPGKPTPAN